MTLTETRTETDFSAARKAMIDSQLRTSGVNDPFVLERMNAVPREEFVPAAARNTAYIDRAITLENGHKIAAPLFYGMVLAEAQPQADDVVLVVDAGSGYLPELIRPLVASVDIVSPEDAVSKKNTRKTYSLVLVDGAIEHVAAPLAKRLGDAGRIVTGITKDGVTRLAVGRRGASEVALLPLIEIGIPRLYEFDEPKGWSF